MTTQQLIGVTAHGITAEWTLESFMLDLIPVEEAETSEYIAERISKTLKEWEINHQAITSITTDGTNNIQTAVTKHLNLPWVWCLAHRLHLIVIKGNSSPLPPQKSPLYAKCQSIYTSTGASKDNPTGHKSDSYCQIL